MAKIFKSILVVLMLPAMLVVTSTFQTYAEDNMTLGILESIFIDFLPFIVVGLFILGIFMAVRNRGSGGDD